MSGIGRAVAAIVLAGAVAGAATFAHLLGSEPAPAPFGIGALPPAPGSPLVVQAAPWIPARPVGPPATPIVRAPAAARPIVSSRIQGPAAALKTPLTTRVHVADPRAVPPAVRAPVAAPAPADRTLAQTAPVVAAVTPVANSDGKHPGDSGRRHGHGRHDPTVLAATPIGSTPPPAETPPPAAIDPPAVDATPGDAGGNEHGRHEHGHGDARDARGNASD